MTLPALSFYSIVILKALFWLSDLSPFETFFFLWISLRLLYAHISVAVTMYRLSFAASPHWKSFVGFGVIGASTHHLGVFFFGGPCDLFALYVHLTVPGQEARDRNSSSMEQQTWIESEPDNNVCNLQKFRLYETRSVNIYSFTCIRPEFACLISLNSTWYYWKRCLLWFIFFLFLFSVCIVLDFTLR